CLVIVEENLASIGQSQSQWSKSKSKSTKILRRMSHKMPNIYNAMVVKGQDIVGQPINVTYEVQQLLGNNWVTVVAMSVTDGQREK
ncbi:hypothetical protein R6Q57_003315, partial [Mikania cordata]